MTDPFTFVVDPFTLAALIGIAAWLDRRLRRVESNLAFQRGFELGRESVKTHTFTHSGEKHDPASTEPSSDGLEV